ncbi:MAG: peptidyl-prolyl cis-trans isomerase [Blastocatellia bacterium]|nr:peptidyl-prolyl cis-trans isomerase [Blastocatellia bacterium]
MIRTSKVLFLIAAIGLFGTAAFAQETEERVIDEVVAQVNDGVITLSRIRREMKAMVDAQVEQGKDRAAAEKELEEKKGELISNLINEELILQRGKELGVERDVDAEVNQRFRKVMEENNLTTVEALFQEMEKNGVNPQEIREMWRNQITRDIVIQREVQAKIYWDTPDPEVKSYYEANKAKFTKPETVTLAELFLSFAGRDEAAVRTKAKELVAAARTGTSFEQLIVENSDRADAAKTKGKVDPIPVSELDPRYGNFIKTLKKGEISDPIEVDDVGISILKIEDRQAASSDSQFDNNLVRMAIVREKSAEVQKKFMTDLREDAYIKINEGYRPLVAPILFADERRTKPGSE